MKKLLVGAVLLTLLGVGGCSNGTTSSTSPPPPTSPPTSSTSSGSDAAARTAPSSALQPFYSQTLTWSSCRSTFQCAKLTVPLDYAKPTGTTIQLEVLKRTADDPSAVVGDLIVNPGGPGEPGTDYAAEADLAFGTPLRDHFDIVGFDPRGTGASDPIDCLTDSQLDSFVATDPEPTTPAEIAAYEGWNRALGSGCVEKSGALASHVTTIESARDMDVLRAALGDPQMDYFGASYGTKLGATYAQLFPKLVGRMVLDGAVDLSISARQLALQQAGGFQTALDSYVANCISQGSCYLGATQAAALTTIKTFLDQTIQTPLPTSSSRMLEGGNAFYGLALPLYNRDYWPILDQALKAGLAGDGSDLLRLSDLYSSRNADGTYANNASEAIYAINCLDDPYSIPGSKVAAQLPAFERESPTFGAVFAWGLTNCEGQVATSTEKPIKVHAAGAAPIVVIGTTRDPATPYHWAQDLAKQLDSGILISRDGDGHTGYNSGNSCVDDAVESYLVDGTVPQNGLSC